MKFLILLSILTAQARAVTFSLYQTAPEAQNLQRFDLGEKSSTYDKKSNYFDKHDDYRIGTLKTAPTPELTKLKSKLTEILKKVELTDRALHQSGMSFNELSDISPHDPHVLLDEYRIGIHSDLYPDLVEIFHGLTKLKWDQVSGFKLSPDFTQLSTVKASKEAGKESFDRTKRCAAPKLPTFCKIKDQGFLYLR